MGTAQEARRGTNNAAKTAAVFLGRSIKHFHQGLVIEEPGIAHAHRTRAAFSGGIFCVLGLEPRTRGRLAKETLASADRKIIFKVGLHASLNGLHDIFLGK